MSQRPSRPYGLDFSAIGGKRQGREVPQSLRVQPGAKHPVWKTQSILTLDFNFAQATAIASISIRKPLGKPAICTVVRAGGWPLNRLP
jgi:hypothetical protein